MKKGKIIMKKRTTFIITSAYIILASMLDFAPLTTTAANNTKAANQPQYIVTAMHNNKLVALDSWDSSHWNKALASPTVLKWENKQARDISLLIVGPIKQINLVDSDGCFVSKLKMKLLKNGAYQVDFVMEPDLAGTEHKIEKDGDPNYVLYRDYYFQIISTDSKIMPQYTSVRYGIN